MGKDDSDRRTVALGRRSLRVLLVEDSEDDAELVIRELVRGGLDVESTRVETAEDMRRALGERSWDIVISDFSMPRFSGPRALGVLHESGVDLPFLIVSGTIGEEAAVEALKGGAHDFLVKGRLARLLPAVDRELREAEIRRAQREAAMALRVNEERFRTLVESMVEHVFTLDKDARCSQMLGAGWSSVGLSREDVLGKTALEIFGAEQGEVHATAARRALSGERVTYETSCTSGDPATSSPPAGPLRHFAVSLSPWRGPSGDVVGAVGLWREITQERLTQAHLATSDRLASIGLLAAGVAHEINSPLAAVIANLDCALRELPHGYVDLREALEDAREASDRIRDIVRDLRLFSRHGDDSIGSVDVERVLDSSLRMARHEVRHRARLVTSYGTVAPVVASESRLGQVFLNLVVNAAHAVSAGQGPSNEIRVATYMKDGRVVVEVTDTGIGMSSETLRRLFTPFFTTKDSRLGTGLGLAISQGIVRGLGGEITVESEPGRGSKFCVLLPAAAEPVREPAPPAPVSAAPRRGRVLVVDDEALVAGALQRALGRQHDVVVYTVPRDALAALERGDRFDVILCDVVMPELGGPELHAEFRRLSPDQADKMVFLTGGAFAASTKEFLDSVPNTHLDKPFDPAAVLTMVNDRIRKSG